MLRTADEGQGRLRPRWSLKGAGTGKELLTPTICKTWAPPTSSLGHPLPKGEGSDPRGDSRPLPPFVPSPDWAGEGVVGTRQRLASAKRLSM